MEIIVALGMLCGAAVTLAALIVSSASLMTAARHRFYATVLARNKIEELLAATETGGRVGDGMDVVGADGAAANVDAAIYTRRWSFVPASSRPDRLAVLEVQVIARLPGSLQVATTTLTTLVEQQP